MTSKYDVRWAHDARKSHDKLGVDYQNRFRRMVGVLEKTPYHFAKAIKRLSGDLSGLYRYRVGKLRIFYTISEPDKAVYISAIDTRGDAY